MFSLRSGEATLFKFSASSHNRRTGTRVAFLVSAIDCVVLKSGISSGSLVFNAFVSTKFQLAGDRLIIVSKTMLRILAVVFQTSFGSGVMPSVSMSEKTGLLMR